MKDRHLTLPEIDAVFATVRGSASPTDASAVASYELETPSRVPRPVLEALVLRHEQVARALRNDLSTLLNRDVDVILEAFDQQRFGTLREACAEPAVAWMPDMAPIREPAFLAVDHALAYAAIDRILGGRGDGAGTPRELTTTETSVLEELVRPILAAHVLAWQPYVPLQPKASRPIAVPRYAREIRSEDILLVAEYRMVGFADGARLRFAMPLSGLEPHLQREPRAVPAAPVKDSNRTDLAASVALAGVEVSIRVGDARLPLEDLMALAPGDVLVLDRKTTDGAELLVQGAPRFRGVLGVHQGAFAFKISESKAGAAAPRKDEPRK